MRARLAFLWVAVLVGCGYAQHPPAPVPTLGPPPTVEPTNPPTVEPTPTPIHSPPSYRLVVDGNEDERAIVIRAGAIWNEALGYTAFSVGSPVPVHWVLTMPPYDLPPGRVLNGLTRTAYRTNAKEVWLWSPMGFPLRNAAALHELGHVLGLSHSLDPLDVMHDPGPAPDLSPNDIQRARQALGITHQAAPPGRPSL